MTDTRFGRDTAPLPGDLDWQVLPQQQHQRGGGAEGTGDPGPGGNGGDSREGAIGRGGRSRSAGIGSRSRSRGVNTGRGKNPGRGYTGMAAQPGGRGAGRGAFSPGGRTGAPGGMFAGLNEKLAAMMEPDLENMRPGALGLIPGVNMAMGIGMAMHDLGEYLGLEMGPPSEAATSPSHGSPADFLEPVGEREAEAPVAPTPMDADAEREKRINRGLSWYRSLLGPSGWQPQGSA